jgi:hypothetical protein
MHHQESAEANPAVKPDLREKAAQAGYFYVGGLHPCHRSHLMGIIDLLKDIPLSAVLKEKIADLESENETLKVKLSEAEEKIRNLEERISHLVVPAEFVEEAGALFKKNADGSWNETPYCPNCQTAMVSPGRHELFRCGKKSCGQFASFKGIGLGDVMCRLPS